MVVPPHSPQSPICDPLATFNPVLQCRPALATAFPFSIDAPLARHFFSRSPNPFPLRHRSSVLQGYAARHRVPVLQAPVAHASDVPFSKSSSLAIIYPFSNQMALYLLLAVRQGPGYVVVPQFLHDVGVPARDALDLAPRFPQMRGEALDCDPAGNAVKAGRWPSGFVLVQGYKPRRGLGVGRPVIAAVAHE